MDTLSGEAILYKLFCLPSEMMSTVRKRFSFPMDANSVSLEYTTFQMGLEI